jgi:aryl carrier-like protein
MMSLIRKPKAGRRAQDADKEHAQIWVNLYKKAQMEEGGMLCLNPEDLPEEQAWLDGNDPEQLLRMLEDYAKRGTFALVDEPYDSIRLMPLRNEYRAARKAGQTHEQVIRDLADRYYQSTRTIERKVRADKS